MKTSKPELDALLDFAWSAWSELGVSSWTRRHRDWQLDPEALLLLTGCLGRVDARLRGEVLDWCSSFGHFLSRARTKTLLAGWPDAAGWPEFAADLTAATSKSWPGADGEGSFTPSGKSRLLLQGRAACLALRARALLGVGARSEILRVMLAAPVGRTWSRTELAEETAYTRRNVHDAVEALLAAGALEGHEHNELGRLVLARAPAWQELLGPLPAPSVGAARLLRAAWAIHCARESWERKDESLRSLEARASWQAIAADLQAAGWPTPAVPAGQDAWQILREWTQSFLEDLAAGSLRQR